MKISMSAIIRMIFQIRKRVSVQELYPMTAKGMGCNSDDGIFQKRVRGHIDAMHKKHEIRSVTRGVWELT